MVRTIKGAEKKLDELWSDKIRKRNGGRCEVCQKEAFHPHHFFGRSNKAVRWELRNGVLLCHQHHTGQPSAHHDRAWFTDWFKQNRLEDYAFLLIEKNKVNKKTLIDYQKMIDELVKI